MPDPPGERVLNDGEQREYCDCLPAQEQRFGRAFRFAYRRAPEEDSHDKLKSEAQYNRWHRQGKDVRPPAPAVVKMASSPLRVQKQIGDTINRQQELKDGQPGNRGGERMKEEEW